MARPDRLQASICSWHRWPTPLAHGIPQPG